MRPISHLLRNFFNYMTLTESFFYVMWQISHEPLPKDLLVVQFALFILFTTLNWKGLRASFYVAISRNK